jgi:Gpi18-like mannosyltransferase
MAPKEIGVSSELKLTRLLNHGLQNRIWSTIQSLVRGKLSRFSYTTVSILVCKVLAVLYLYFRFGGPGRFYTTTILLYAATGPSPSYLSVGWDSLWYMDIAKVGYTRLASYAFFPFYPLVIRLFYSISNDIALSAVIPSFICGIAAVPLFQRLAEEYMDRRSAIACTLVAFFFPVIFVFTSLAYGESIFVLLSLLYWLQYRKQRITRASIILALATITRPFGGILGIPLAIDLLRQRRFRDLLNFAIPSSALFSWLYYGFYSTGNWLAFRVAETSTIWTQVDWIRGTLLPFFAGKNVPFEATNFFMVTIVGLLVVSTFHLDWRLGTLAAATYLSVLLFSGPPELSYLRYFSFIFPIWLITGRGLPLKIVIPYCFFMMAGSLMMWHAFAFGGWVG